MMAGNPNCNWWSMHPPSSTLIPQYASNIPFNPLLTTDHQNPEPTPHSWSQLLFTGLAGEEDRLGFTHFQPKKLDNWDHHFLDLSSARSLVPINNHIDVIKQEDSPQISSGSGNLYSHGSGEFQAVAAATVAGAGSCNNWSHLLAVSSPSSCVTTTTLNTSNNKNNILDFTYNKHSDHAKLINHLPDQSSECNSTSTTSVGGVCKKARVQPSSTQPHLKVRKEKLGDRITALHQLVSPFGKTDTASVLLEAIGYIRFLQGQIEALSSPYLTNASKNNMRNHQQFSSALLNDNGLKRKGAPNQDAEDHNKLKDLKSRGLCLVPVSCTQHVGNENGADYWAPAFGTGF